MRPILAAALLALAACSDVLGSPDVTGAYHLETVDGQPLPYVLTETTNDRIEVTGVVLTIEPAGSYETVTRGVYTNAGREPLPVQQVDRGKWTQGGRHLTFDPGTMGAGSGELSGSRLTITYRSGRVVAYRRE